MLRGPSKHEEASSAAAQTLLLKVQKEPKPLHFIPLYSLYSALEWDEPL